jgi:hypothetical protein
MISNFHKVDKGIYRGASPSPKDVRLLHDKYGIDKIVSLDEISGKIIDRACKLLNITHIMLPIDMNKRSSLLKFLSHDITNLLGGGHAFVHCHYGRDRTSLACALYRCKHDGWTCTKAIKEAKSFGFGTDIPPSIFSLYERIIRHACGCGKAQDDVNAAYDIVSNQQENPSNNLGYTLDALEQLSWSPYNDYRVREFPYSTIDSGWPEQYQSRNDYGLDDALYQDLEHDKGMEIPQVGTYDQNTSGINGAGPSLIGGGFI